MATYSTADATQAIALSEILGRRRSVREFCGVALLEREIRHLLWAAQGVTDEEGHRTAALGRRTLASRGVPLGSLIV